MIHVKLQLKYGAIVYGILLYRTHICEQSLSRFSQNTWEK